jgi:hypothetical protein
MSNRLVPLAVLLLSLAGPLFALPRDEPPPEAPPTLTEDQRTKLMDSLKKATFEEAQVLLLRRPPQHASRQVLYHRYLEQWVYDHPYFIRIEIDHRRGQKPQILTVHSLAPSRP